MSSDPLSCKRYYARLRRERELEYRINPYAVRSTVPFPEWLRCVRGVEDWTKLSRYALWNSFLDYRVDCTAHEMHFDSASIYGLTNV